MNPKREPDAQAPSPEKGQTLAQDHWNRRYGQGDAQSLTWYQNRPDQSLKWILSRAAPSSPLLDLGAGASTLVDHLLDAKFEDISLLDLSEIALHQCRVRLGNKAEKIHWICSDLRDFHPDRTYALVHDRAVFHFLTEEADRRKYKAALRAALRPGGLLILGTFAPGGPERCSGLPIVQYDAASVQSEFGSEFRLLESTFEQHPTPAGGTQLFHWALLERNSPSS
jgi:SAM-dependent methyltransferase